MVAYHTLNVRKASTSLGGRFGGAGDNVGWKVTRKVDFVGKLDNCCQCGSGVVVQANWGLKAIILKGAEG